MTTLSRGSHGPQVAEMQCMLNVALDRQPPLRPDGDFGTQTLAAVNDFQSRSGTAITGQVEEGDLEAIRAAARERGWRSAPRPAEGEPLWLRIARGEDQQAERPGAEQNPRILDYIATFPYLKRIPGRTAPTMGDQDETAWCACFVNWCVLRAGQFEGPDASAASWRSYGTTLETPVEGCIAVIYNTPSSDTASGYHVAFVVRSLADRRVLLFGGNQSNKVCEKAFAFERIWYRWPGPSVMV